MHQIVENILKTIVRQRIPESVLTDKSIVPQDGPCVITVTIIVLGENMVFTKSMENLDKNAFSWTITDIQICFKSRLSQAIMIVTKNVSTKLIVD